MTDKLRHCMDLWTCESICDLSIVCIPFVCNFLVFLHYSMKENPYCNLYIVSYSIRNSPLKNSGLLLMPE